MNVADFLAFADEHPKEEHWELINGVPVLNDRPTWRHQVILKNALVALHGQALGASCSWEALPRFGVRISDVDMVFPDVLVRPAGSPDNDPQSRECNDAIMAFEVLSPSIKACDLHSKRHLYASLPSLTHCVMISQDEIDVLVCARDADFIGRRLTTLTSSLAFPVGASLPVAAIYSGTELE